MRIGRSYVRIRLGRRGERCDESREGWEETTGQRVREEGSEVEEEGGSSKHYLPIVLGLKADSTSSNIQPFQYSLEIAREGGW